jgi:hypothetical protein
MLSFLAVGFAMDLFCATAEVYACSSEIWGGSVGGNLEREQLPGCPKLGKASLPPTRTMGVAAHVQYCCSSEISSLVYSLHEGASPVPK